MEQATRALLQEYCENYWDLGLGLNNDYLEFTDEKFDILLNIVSNHDQAIRKCTQEQLVRFPFEIDSEVIVAHVVLQLSDDKIINFKRLALTLWDPHKKIVHLMILKIARFWHLILLENMQNMNIWEA